jgi:hypothetical protein
MRAQRCGSRPGGSTGLGRFTRRSAGQPVEGGGQVSVEVGTRREAAVTGREAARYSLCGGTGWGMLSPGAQEKNSFGR